MNFSDFDHDQLLTDLNNDKARLFVPAILYLGILMILGTVGNCMVIYFYGCKCKPSPSASFILALAIFDLASCVVGMPMEIADLRYYFNFKSELACKILRCITHFASISSGLTLVVIAVDRYRRICKPFHRQLNNKHVKFICVSTGVLSLALSWPAVIFNDVIDVDVEYSKDIMLIGKDCTTTKSEKYKSYIQAFNIVYLAAFVIITIVLSVLYSFISRQLYRHRQFRLYVARGGTNARRINVKSASDEQLLAREASTLSNRVFADPPDASGSIVDMKEFVTRGLTQVECDRPSSGYTAVTGTTGLTGLTDLSGRSRRTLHSTKSMKSVTIDPSQNQVIHIEAREKVTQRFANIESTWTNVSDRSGSPSATSFATFSSRPSSAALSGFNEPSRIPQRPGFNESRQSIVQNGSALDDSDTENENDENAKTFEDDTTDVAENDGRQSIKVFEHDIDGETVTVTNESVSSSEENSDIDDEEELPNDHLENDDKEDDANAEHQTLENNEDIINDDGGNVYIDRASSRNSGTANDTEELKSTNNRPSSSISSKSSKSWRTLRSNVITPLSTVSTTTSVASRASTVRRIRRFFQKHGDKLKTDSDEVKELRMKMLDINTVKYTFVMLVITVVFVISFLPYLSLVIWRYYNEEHEVNVMTDTALVLFQIGLRSIFINSTMNPLIYGGFNSKFRAFFYTICCSCCFSTKKIKKNRTLANDHSDSTSGT